MTCKFPFIHGVPGHCAFGRSKAQMALLGFTLLAQGLFLCAPMRGNVLSTTWLGNNGTNNWSAYGNQWGWPNGPFASPGAPLAGVSSAAFSSAGSAGSVINLDS